MRGFPSETEIGKKACLSYCDLILYHQKET